MSVITYDHPHRVRDADSAAAVKPRRWKAIAKTALDITVSVLVSAAVLASIIALRLYIWWPASGH
jgi:hypothetical protein